MTLRSKVPLMKSRQIEYLECGMRRIMDSIQIGNRSQDEFRDDLGEIYDCLCLCYHNGWRFEDAISYAKCLEHFNPELNEDIALERMAKIRSKYV